MEKDYERKIDEAVRALHYVGEDNVIEIYADYRENGEFLQETVYENRDSEDLESIVRDKLWEAYAETISQYEDEILKEAGYEPWENDADEAREYLREKYSIEPDYDHFLGHEMKVNIMLRTDNERNNEYTTIHEQYVAMVNPDALTQPDETLKEDSMLTWLLKQQGHTLDELLPVMKDYNKFFYDAAYPNGNIVKHYGEDGKELNNAGKIELFNKTHNAFLTSVCQELENQSYEMGVMTVLAKTSIEDFIKMQSGDKEITFSKDCMIGIYNPWNGSGSVLEIELEKDLVFSTDMIRDIQIEGIKPQWEYTVDDAFGLVGSCWKEPKSVEDISSPSKELRDDIETYIENNLKYFELDGVEITGEDVDLAAQKVKQGQSLEEACEEVLSGIRECLDEGLDEKPALSEVIKTCSEMSKNGNRDTTEKGAIDREER